MKQTPETGLTYFVCGDELGKTNPIAEAATRILSVLGWREVNVAEARAADVLVLCHTGAFAVDNRDIKFLHQYRTGQLRHVLLLDTPQAGAWTGGPRVESSSSNWLYRLRPESCDVVGLFDWLSREETPADCANVIEIRADRCKELLSQALTGLAPEDGNKHELTIGKYGPCVNESKDIFSFYYALLRICHAYAEDQHDDHKESVGSGNPFVNDAGWLERRKKIVFREACHDLRSSLDWLLPTEAERTESPDVILLIDDNPNEYETLLAAVRDSFLTKHEIWLSTVAASNPLLRYICTYHSIAHQSGDMITELKNLPLRQLGSQESTTLGKQTGDFSWLRKVRFILVDQLYKQEGKPGIMHGPDVIRGLSRILRDIPWEKYGSRRALPEFVALSRSDDIDVIQRALQAGARSYVVKSRLLSLPGVLGKIRRIRSLPSHSLHRNFRTLSGLPNETIGLLQAVKIPRIALARKEDRRIKAADRAIKVADMLRDIPKPDLHVHLGSCMSTEFLVVASLVGLLRHDLSIGDKPDSLRTLVEFFANLRPGATIQLTLERQLYGAVENAIGSGDPYPVTLSDEEDVKWIERIAVKVVDYLIEQLKRPTDSQEYLIIRAVLHSTLGIPDFLPVEDAEKKLKAKPFIDIAIFAIRYSDKRLIEWDSGDIVRVYLLTLASRYLNDKGERPSLRLDDKTGFDFLCLFGGKCSELDSEACITNWNAIRKILYGGVTDSGIVNQKAEKGESSLGGLSIEDFKKRGWRCLPGPSVSLALKWIDSDQSPGTWDPFYQANMLPIERELATGLTSSNLIQYLQGCEFSGAEHMKHPYLVHLYAQQAVVKFIEQGVFYAELRCSPDGFADEDRGFGFSGVCRCLVEAFSQAQEVAVAAYQNPGIVSRETNSAWIAGALGSRFGLDSLCLAMRGSCGAAKRLPCKVSLVFVGKRHKSTREMILEAAAAAVMRPPGEKKAGSAKAFVENEMIRCRVVGFDLAGREYDNPPVLFVDEFSRLSRLHIPLTIHAGENAPVRFIEDAILLLQAKRIGHGLALSEDRRLMTRIREDRVCIELCPIGNHQTSQFVPPESESGGRSYPLKALLEHGIHVSINTDNPVVSATNLVMEYFQASYAYDKLGLSIWDALRIMRMGYVCSFLHLPERKAMIEVVEQYIFEFFSNNEVVSNLHYLADTQVYSHGTPDTQ